MPFLKIGECSRCGECCGDDDNGWCEHLVGRPPGPTTCTYQGYPRPCGDDGNWPYDREVQLPVGCTYKWVSI